MYLSYRRHEVGFVQTERLLRRETASRESLPRLSLVAAMSPSPISSFLAIFDHRLARRPGDGDIAATNSMRVAIESAFPRP